MLSLRRQGVEDDGAITAGAAELKPFGPIPFAYGFEFAPAAQRYGGETKATILIYVGFPPMADQITALRFRAAQCRQLAGLISGETARTALLQMADEIEIDVKRLEEARRNEEFEDRAPPTEE